MTIGTSIIYFLLTIAKGSKPIQRDTIEDLDPVRKQQIAVKAIIKIILFRQSHDKKRHIEFA